MPFYKIVRNNMKSVIDHANSVTYKVGEWIGPNISNSRLFVFDTMESVNKFLEREFSSGILFKIFECEIEKSELQNGIMVSTFLLGDEDIVDFWNGHGLYKTTVPKGTIFADRIKLIKEVA